MAQPSRSPPLGKLVEDAYGYSTGYRLVRGLMNWRRYREIISYEAPKYSQDYFRKHVRQSQLKSGQVLQEWWNSAYHVRSFMQASQSAFFQSAVQILSGDLEWVHHDPKDKENQYHRQLFSLWIHEFMVYDEDVNEKSLCALFTVRRQGVTAATCQRLAHSVFEVIVRAVLQGSIHSDIFDVSESPNARYTMAGVVNLSASVDPCPWLGLDEELVFKSDSSTQTPYFLWDRTLQCTVKSDSLARKPKYCVISHTWGRWRLEQEHIELKGVPWQVPQNSRFKVEDLPNQLDAPFFSERYLWIDLLCIPQSTDTEELLAIRAVEIGRQAEIFQDASRACAWLPEVSDWLELRWACAWMALKYFRDSQYPGQRDDYVTNLMRATQEYANHSTGLVMPWDYDSRPAPHEIQPSAWFTSLWTLQEACIRPDMVLLNKHMHPFCLANTWIVPLDSIIALVNGYQNTFGWQMLLEWNQNTPNLPVVFDRRYLYEAFSVLEEVDRGKSFHNETYRVYAQGAAHTWKYPAGKDGGDLKHLVDPARDIDGNWMSEEEFVPQGTTELLYLLRLTGLDQVLNVTRTEILWHANGRYCKRSRAEAIMSVVGVTKWYYDNLREDHPVESGDSERLVLQTYPDTFLQEVISTTGAAFFASQPRYFDLMTPLAVIQHKDGTMQEVRVISGKGTLLPIERERKYLVYHNVYDLPHGVRDHPSLTTWQLLSTGSFNLREAGILATSSDEIMDGEEIIVRLTAPRVGTGISPGSSIPQNDVNFRHWLRDFMPPEYKAALVLYSSPEYMGGIILLESSSLLGNMKFNPRQFVKIGTWYSDRHVRVPKSQTVNWRVL